MKTTKKLYLFTVGKLSLVSSFVTKAVFEVVRLLQISAETFWKTERWTLKLGIDGVYNNYKVNASNYL